jgi:hypothetical protein
MSCAEKMKGNARLIADDPAIVQSRRDVEKFAGSEFYYSAILERGCRGAEEDQSNVFDPTVGSAHDWPNMLAPSPAWLVRGPADGYAAEMHKLETALLELANFVWCVESLQDHP